MNTDEIIITCPEGMPLEWQRIINKICVYSCLSVVKKTMTDYEKSDTGKVIEEIIYKLQQASKSESELAKSIKQLEH